MDLDISRDKIGALLEPRNVVLVGATDRPGSWAGSVWRNLNRFSFPKPVYLLNPRRSELWGEKVYGSFGDLPEPPDHMVVLVPAEHVCDTLRSGAAAGARSATIFSAGFDETPHDGSNSLAVQLRELIAETGLAVSGPNCIGNICVKSRLVSIAEERPRPMRPGPVAMAGQSGGVLIHLTRAMERRGLDVGYLVSTGNEAGLSTADFISYYAAQDEVKVIFVYVEALRDAPKFLAACRLARAAGKSVVAIKLGRSDAGRSAAMAHTGSLAGSVQAFEALCAQAGVILADGPDQAIELTELLIHTGSPAGNRLAGITISGAYRGFLLDNAERAGLEFPPLSDNALRKLREILGVGAIVGNPIDGGFAVITDEKANRACIEILQAEPDIDMIVIQQAVPDEAGSDIVERSIAIAQEIASKPGAKPIAFFAPASHGLTDYGRELRRTVPNVSFLQEVNKSLQVIGAVVKRDREEALHDPEPGRGPELSAAQQQAIDDLHAAAAAGQIALDETESKSLLRPFGLALPREMVARTVEEGIEAAARIGYPVVIKAVSPELLHKTEAGAVILDIKDAEEFRSAWAALHDNVARSQKTSGIDCVLIAEMVQQGVEFVLGAHHDPEAGMVVMAGAGGVFVELLKDVQLAAPPLTERKARQMLRSLRASRLLDGFRGNAKLDDQPIVDALLALSRLIEAAGDHIQSVDINPFVITASRGVALDALVILRGGNGEKQGGQAGPVTHRRDLQEAQ